jgi:hypothetical protein
MQTYLNTYLDRSGDYWVTECIKINFLPSGDTSQHDAPY